MRFEFNLHLSSWHIAKFRLLLIALRLDFLLKWWRKVESDHHRFKHMQHKHGAPCVPTFQIHQCIPPKWWYDFKFRFGFAYRHSFRSGYPRLFLIYWRSYPDIGGSLWDG